MNVFLSAAMSAAGICQFSAGAAQLSWSVLEREDRQILSAGTDLWPTINERGGYDVCRKSGAGAQRRLPAAVLFPAVALQLGGCGKGGGQGIARRGRRIRP